jgi:hypothetical protein
MHVTQLGNGEGLKDTLFLNLVEPQNTFHFLVICQSPVTGINDGNSLTRTVNRPTCFNPCGNYTQADSSQAESR